MRKAWTREGRNAKSVWNLVRTFVRTYFGREDKAVAAKSTYDVLLSEIRKQYPDFDFHKNAFKTHVGQ